MQRWIFLCLDTQFAIYLLGPQKTGELKLMQRLRFVFRIVFGKLEIDSHSTLYIDFYDITHPEGSFRYLRVIKNKHKNVER